VYATPLGDQDPAIGALDRPEDRSIEEASTTVLERRGRLLRMRQRAMRAANPRLPEPGSFIPPDEAA
jgi:hypothetical protein